MTNMTMLIKNVKDIPAVTPPHAPGMLFKFLSDESNSKSMRAGLMSLGPRTIDQSHYHSVEELQLVLNGHLTLKDCNGRQYPLKPGSFFFCPPGIGGTHGIENTSDFPATLLFIYPRQDIETVKHDPAPGKKHRSGLVIKNIADIKLGPLMFPDVRMKMLCDGSIARNLLAGIMCWDPGSKLPPEEQPHYHNVEEFQFVLYGNSTLIDCNGKKHPLSEGVSFLCPPGIGGAHGVENTSNFPTAIFFAYPTLDFKNIPFSVT